MQNRILAALFRSTLSLSVLATTEACAPQVPQPTFAAPIPIPNGPGFRLLAAADWNGDGTLDLAVGQSEKDQDGIAMILNQGGGIFGPIVSTTMGSLRFLWSTAAGDLDGDGLPDLVLAGEDDVSVMRNQGDGTFASAQSVGAGPHLVAAALGDVDQNGLLDIVLANNDGTNNIGTVNLLLNRGGMRFEAKPFGIGRQVGAVQVADLNGDGHPDLIAAADDHISVLLNQGGGAFLPPQNYPTSVQLFPIADEGAAVADYDGDGAVDVAAVNYQEERLNLLRNRGDGTFSASKGPELHYGCQSIWTNDLNHDGKPDLIVQQLVEFGYRLLLNQGDGSFTSPQPLFQYFDPNDLLFGDFDGDGKPDIVTTFSDGQHQSVNVVLNRSE